MRSIIPAAIVLLACSAPSRAVISVSEPNQCSDRNALQSMAYDARLVAIKLYYQGFTQNITDKDRQTCYKTHVLTDDHFAIINKTRALIETNCLSIDVAARIATEGLCP
jgi:hypothetical protein